VFWPAAPVMLLWKGQDININRGVAFDVYTDSTHPLGSIAPVTTASRAAALPVLPAVAVAPGASATISIMSASTAAEIEVDGVFVGNTPTTLQLGTGTHRIVVKNGVKSWQRDVHVNGGSTVSLNAVLQ
jgi:PEGA domain